MRGSWPRLAEKLFTPSTRPPYRQKSLNGAALMAEHVGVNPKGKASALGDALHQSVDRIRRERAAALGGKHKGAVGGSGAARATLAPRRHPSLASRQLRMARVGDVVLLDHPTDASAPRSINCYLVEVQDATLGANGKKFKIVPERLLYSLRWKHNATPPDFELVLIQDNPVGWVNTANLTLLSALRRRAPQAIDWAGMPDVVPVLDAFEAAAARRH